jgi:hypothetical protein
MLCNKLQQSKIKRTSFLYCTSRSNASSQDALDTCVCCNVIVNPLVAKSCWTHHVDPHVDMYAQPAPLRIEAPLESFLSKLPFRPSAVGPLCCHFWLICCTSATFEDTFEELVREPLNQTSREPFWTNIGRPIF